MLSRYHNLSPALHHAFPTLAGLAVIPLVVPHIDEAVTHWMDTNVRPHLNLPSPVHSVPGGTGAEKKHNKSGPSKTSLKPVAHL